MEAMAKKLIRLFSDIHHNQADIDSLAWWTVYLAHNKVLARIVFFSERILHWNEASDD